jgi:hypothetical protein
MVQNCTDNPPQISSPVSLESPHRINIESNITSRIEGRIEATTSDSTHPTDISFLPSSEKSPSAQLPTESSKEGLGSRKEEALLDSLTEEQTNLWTRWCVISHTPYDTFNENMYQHVVALADKIVTTEQLQSLYDFVYARLKSFSEDKGTNFTPPRLYNLVKACPEWQAIAGQKERECMEKKRPVEFVSGSGNMTNFTQLRLQGKMPTIDYSYREVARPTASSKPGNIRFEDLPQALRQKQPDSRAGCLVERKNRA